MIKKLLIIPLLILLSSKPAKADLFGGDLPLLAKIVFNTLHTLYELQRQSNLMKDELAGIHDKIYRIKTIADVVQPSTWNEWKNPEEALRRLKVIYHTLPPEYKSEKSDAIERELSKAMNMVARVSGEATTTFKSGKEMEVRGADASPGVAQKLTASGVGTLIAMESQSQVIQSHMVSLLAQIVADANEKESRAVVSKGKNFASFSGNLGKSDNRFSALVMPFRMAP